MNARTKTAAVVAGIVAVLCVLVLLIASVFSRDTGPEGEVSGGDPAEDIVPDGGTGQGTAETPGAVTDQEVEDDTYGAAFVGMTEEEVTAYYGLEEEAVGASYDSSPVSFVYDSDGGTITVGVEGETDGKGLYLVPECSAADADRKVGFYFIRSNYLETASADGAGGIYDGQNPGYDNFVIVGQTYDRLIPADYHDDYFGIRWTDIERTAGGVTERDTVYARAVDLMDDRLLATFRIEIAYEEDTDTYYIADVYNSDVSCTGELTEPVRDALVNAAVDLIYEDLNYQYPDASAEPVHGEDAIVEKVPRTYFSQIYSAKTEVLDTDATVRDGTVYAVSVPVDGMGFFTAYYVPEELLLYGFSDSDYGDLVLFGYDALTPFTVDSIYAVNGFIP